MSALVGCWSIGPGMGAVAAFPFVNRTASSSAMSPSTTAVHAWARGSFLYFSIHFFRSSPWIIFDLLALGVVVGLEVASQADIARRAI